MLNKFKITSELSKSVKDDLDLQEDGSLILEGIASTTSIDLEGDTISPECINSMKKQALSCNIHGDHMIGLDDVIGTVQEVLNTDDETLKIKFIIIPSVAPMIKEKLDCGVKLGLSIRGTVNDFEETSEGWQINEINLIEISLTALPANWDTMGTITTSKGLVLSKCLSGACQQIMKNHAENVLMEEEMSKEKNIHNISEEDLVNLFKEMSEPLRNEIKAELKKELKDEIGEQAKIEIRDEITDELQDAIKKDITDEVKVDVVDDIIDEVKNGIETEKSSETEDEEDSVETITEEAENEDIEEVNVLSEEDIPSIENNTNDVEKYHHPVEVQHDINLRRLSRNIEKNVEEKILNDLGVNRDPKSETEKFIKNWIQKEEAPQTDKRKTMSRKDIVERMKNTTQSSNPFYRALKEIQDDYE